MKHHHMKMHDGGKGKYGSVDSAEMRRMNEPPEHKEGAMNIVHHQEHLEGEHQHTHYVHHFGSHGKGHKS